MEAPTGEQPSAVVALDELLEEHADAVVALPWPSEDERWAELIVCIVGSYLGWDDARALTDDLGTVGLLRPDQLALIDGEDPEASLVARFVLREHGLTGDRAAALVAVLSRTATATTSRYGGRIQAFIREQGLRIAAELGAAIMPGEVPAELRSAILFWLQNAFSIPVPIDDAPVVAFAEARGFTTADLVAAADERGLNLALVDDLVRAHQAAEG